MSEGYVKGEVCNREGCTGVIDAYDKEGCCSCHTNPPCGYCETPAEFCPVCGWDALEEKREYLKNDLSHSSTVERLLEKAIEREELFFKKFSGKLPITEFDYFKKSHTHFSMEVFGIHPKGFDLNTVMHKIRGTFGGRFKLKTDTTFIYIAYTD